MQRIASQSRHGSLLPTIVGKGIDPASGLCRGEQELYILLRRSQWNDLGPLCRMTLLRDCAHQHNQWAQFTAKCQLWVLHEVARASGEIRQQAGSPLTDEAAVESREALEFVRMKSLVQADPSLARELTDLYEQTPSLIAPVQRLRMELRAQDERTSLALSRSQSMFRVGAPRRNTSPSGSPQSGRHSRMSMTSPTAMRQAQQRTQSPAGRNEARSLARTASAPELNSREITIRPGRLAPLLNERRAAGCAAAPGDSRSGRGSRRKGKNQPAAKDDVSGDKLEKIKEGRRKSISKEKPEATAEESPAANNGTRDAPSYEEYFKGGTEELVPQEAEEGQEPQNTRMLARTFFTLLPTQSSAGKAAKQRNDRRKVVKAAVARTTEVAKAAHAKLRGLPTAFVYVEGPGAELKKVLQEIERATQDIHVSIAESMDVTTASEETITYEVLINDDITLSRLCEILESSFASKKLPYMVRTRPPYERVLVAFSQAFPGLGKVAFADLEALMLVVAESYRLYAMAWADLKSVKDVAKEIEELQTKESRILCANELVDIADERTQNMPADLLRHSANSGDDVLADAITAHLKIKEMLAPGTDWAQADLNDLEEVPADDPCRNWECRVDGAFKNAVHHDPGVVIPGGSTGLEDRAKPNLRPYELELQVCEEVFVSHIDITFEYFPAIAMAVDELVEGFPVVWVENMFVRPNALGERYVSVGVRVSWEAEGGVHLQYVAELRLHQQAMRAVSLGTPMSECKEQMLAALDACGLQPQQINVAMEVFLRAVDCNEEALKRRSSRDLERVSSWIFDVTNELEEVLTEADIQSCYNLVACCTVIRRHFGKHFSDIKRPNLGTFGSFNRVVAGMDHSCGGAFSE